MPIRVRDAASGSEVELPDDEAYAQLADGRALPVGGGRLRVVGPDGTRGTIPAENLGGAVRDGFRLYEGSPQQTTDDRNRDMDAVLGPVAGTPVETLLATGVGALRGPTVGLSDAAAGEFGRQTLGDDRVAERLDTLRERNPIADTVGDVGGTLGALLIPGAGQARGAGLLARGLRGLTAPARAVEGLGGLVERGAIRALGGAGETAASRVLRQGVAQTARGATEGVAEGVVRGLSDAALHDGEPDDYAERVLAGAQTGALWGAGAGGLLGGGSSLVGESVRGLVGAGSGVLRRAWRAGVGTELDEGAAELASYSLGDAMGDLGPRGRAAREIILNGDRVLDDGTREAVDSLMQLERARAQARGLVEAAPNRGQVARLLRQDLGQALNMGGAGDRALDAAVSAAERARRLGEELVVDGATPAAMRQGRELIASADRHLANLRRQMGDAGDTLVDARRPNPLRTVEEPIGELDTLLPDGSAPTPTRVEPRPRRRVTADQAADAYLAASDLRRSMDRAVGQLDLVDPAGFASAVRARDEIRGVLENERLWGRRIVEQQRDVARALDALEANRRAFERRFIASDMGAVDPERVRGFLGRAGTAASDLDAKIFRDYIEAQGRLGDVVDRIRGGSSGRAREAAAGALAALDRAESRARILNQYRAMVHDADMSGRGLGARLVGRVVGGAAGGLIGGHTGAVAGAVLGGGASAMAQPATRLRMLAMVDRLASRVDGRIADSVRTFIRRATGGARRVGRAARSTTYRAGHLADPKAFEERMELLREQRSSDAALQQRLAQGTRDLDEHAPGVRDAVHTAALRGVGFLAARTPTPSGMNGTLMPGISGRPRYLEQDRVRFMRLARIVDNPLAALDDLEDGRLTADSVEALKEVYPSIYQAIIKETMSELAARADRGHRLSYEDRTQLSLLLGTPTDPTLTPEFIAMFQRTFQMAGQRRQQSRTSGARPISDTLSTSSMTATQSLEMRQAGS